MIQEAAFEHAADLDAALVLFWSSLYALVGYVVAIPLTMLPYLGNMVGLLLCYGGEGGGVTTHRKSQ